MPGFARIAVVSMAAMLCCQDVSAADREERRERATTDAGVTDGGDAENLTNYYRRLGFFCARVGRDVSNNPGSVNLTVDLGPRYRVSDVKLVGNRRYREEMLSQRLRTKSGSFFDQGALNADLAALGKLYDGPGEKVQADFRFGDKPGEVEMVYVITEAACPQ